MTGTVTSLGAAAIREAVVSGRCSASEVTAAHLQRMADLDPGLGAFVTPLPAAAQDTAAVLDAALARGEPPGLLHGVPVGIKDLFDTAGVVTAAGTRVMAQRVPAADATVVARLRAAGAVVLGKLKLTEGAFSSHHPDLQAPVNPRRADLWSGVSSSGSGVAVAAGLCAAALGTDTGGSIRFPSAANAILGLKPSYGRVSRSGGFPLADSLDHVGPMARQVIDLALLLQVLAGHDPLDPTSSSAPVPDYQAAVRAAGTDGVQGLAVGLDRDYGAKWLAPAVAEALELALQVLVAAGAGEQAVQVPAHQALVDGWVVTCGVEAALAHAPWFPKRRQDYGDQLAMLLDVGLAANGLAYARLERQRELFRAAMDASFAKVPLLLAPALPGPVPTLAEQAQRLREGSSGFMTFTAPWNYSGHPSLTLPAGSTADGKPLAIQLLGPHLGEPLLLRAAAVLEASGHFGCPGVALG